MRDMSPCSSSGLITWSMICGALLLGAGWGGEVGVADQVELLVDSPEGVETGVPTGKASGGNAPEKLVKAVSPKRVSSSGASELEPAMTGRTNNSEVSPNREAMVRRIDALIEQRWKEKNISPAPRADDAEFLRRASLDLTGVIPRVSAVRAFLADDRPDKRRRLIESLLASPRYATHMATTWRNRLLPEETETPQMGQVVGVQNWLRDQFAKNRSYNALVGDLLVATNGNELGPALYFQSQGLAPEKLAASTAELFLGMRLHCAQCHDHPYGEWRQEDFWGYAAFFARVRGSENQMSMNQYRLLDASEGEVKLPDSDKIIPPKYLGGRPARDDEGGSRRLQLAIWVSSRDNPYLAKAAVNWAWSHLFGRGIVDPVGDAGDHNLPSHPELLDELSEYFVESNYDLRELLTTIANTQAYQLSSQTESSEPCPDYLFARMSVKAFTPEQLYDSILRAAPVKSASGAMNSNALSVAPASAADSRRAEFIRRIRTPGQTPTDFSSGILQALMVMNGKTMSEGSAENLSRLLGALDADFLTDADRVETLYLATLSRMPRAEERERALRFLRPEPDQETDGRKDEKEKKVAKKNTESKSTESKNTEKKSQNAAMADLLWVLLNSTEFAFNH